MRSKSIEHTTCPLCGSTNIENYVPGPDDGQGAYWPKIQCNDCMRTSDGCVKCYDHSLKN